MKIKIAIFFLFLASFTYSKDSLRWLRYGTYFTAGMAEGYSDVLNFHYYKFQKLHPNANANYWNPSISWVNKYDNVQERTENFPLSTTALVWLTDGWHLSKFVKNCGIFGGLCIPLQRGKKWWWYIKEGAICYGINRIGFNLIYNGVYR